MREDELRQLREQRMDLVTELRTFNEAMQQRVSENNGELLADDEQEFARREKELIDLNKRIEIEQRTEYAARFSPDTLQYGPQDGAPGTGHR